MNCTCKCCQKPTENNQAICTRCSQILRNPHAYGYSSIEEFLAECAVDVNP